MTTEIRLLGPTDVETAQEVTAVLKTRSAAAPVDATYLERFLAGKRSVVLAALDHGTPVGFLLAYVRDRIDSERPMVLLYEIEVAPGHRRCGVGRALIEALKDLSRDVGAVKLWAPTDRSNLAAVALYKAAGMVESAADDGVIFELASGDPEQRGLSSG